MLYLEIRLLVLFESIDYYIMYFIYIYALDLNIFTSNRHMSNR